MAVISLGVEVDAGQLLTTDPQVLVGGLEGLDGGKGGLELRGGTREGAAVQLSFATGDPQMGPAGGEGELAAGGFEPREGKALEDAPLEEGDLAIGLGDPQLSLRGVV